jgi:putative flippase GtrA
MRIYFLLLRFTLLSLATAVIDNIVFVSAFSFTANIAASQISGRIVATVFNYIGARRAVFRSQQRHAVVLPKYFALVAANGVVSYTLIQLLHLRAGMAVLPAKLLAEGLLFAASFVIQRDFVFTGRRAPRTEPAAPPRAGAAS